MGIENLVSFELEEPIDQLLAVDPFGWMPNWASRIPGLGGPTLCPDPTYVFRTVTIRPATGEVTIRVQFVGCVASGGTLQIDVDVTSSVPGAMPGRMRTIEVPLEQLAVSDGIIDVVIDARRNTLYSISGHLAVGELEAAAVIITVDRRERPGDHGHGWRQRAEPLPISPPDGAMIASWITSLETPTLDSPRSQPMTERQCLEPAYARWAKALNRTAEPQLETWSYAYVLEVLERHSAIAPGASGLCFSDGVQPIPAYLASRDCQVLVAGHLPRGAFAIDPGEAVDRLRNPDICDDARFSNLVHHSMFDNTLVAESLRFSSDFVWSIGLNRKFDLPTYISFIHNSMNYLRAGGLAIHVFDFVYNRGDALPQALSRVEVERVALISMSHLNDVVRLLFRHSGKSTALVRKPTLYGLVMRRGGTDG